MKTNTINFTSKIGIENPLKQVNISDIFNNISKNISNETEKSEYLANLKPLSGCIIRNDNNA